MSGGIFGEFPKNRFLNFLCHNCSQRNRHKLRVVTQSLLRAKDSCWVFGSWLLKLPCRNRIQSAHHAPISWRFRFGEFTILFIKVNATPGKSRSMNGKRWTPMWVVSGDKAITLFGSLGIGRKRQRRLASNRVRSSLKKVKQGFQASLLVTGARWFSIDSALN